MNNNYNLYTNNQQQAMNIENQQNIQSQQPKKNNKVIIFVVIVIFIIVGLIFGISYLKNNNTINDEQENSNNNLQQENNTQNNSNNSSGGAKEHYEKLNALSIVIVGEGKSALTSAITKLYGDYTTIEAIDEAEEHNYQGITYKSTTINYKTKNRSYIHYSLPNYDDYFKSLISKSIKPDAAILVVSAIEGIVPQTKEYLNLLEQVGVSKIVVYLDKCDMVSTDKKISALEKEIRDLIDKYDFEGENTTIIQGSALKAIDGDKDSESSIHKLLSSMDNWNKPYEDNINDSFNMPINNVFLNHNGLVAVKGTINSGSVKLNDEIEIVGLVDNQQKATIVGIKIDEQQLEMAMEGDTVSMSLHGVSYENIKIGQVLATVGSVKADKNFESYIYLFPKEDGKEEINITSNFKLDYKFSTIIVPGTITLTNNVEKISLGNSTNAIINLEKTMPLRRGDNYQLYKDGKIIGLGLILEKK